MFLFVLIEIWINLTWNLFFFSFQTCLLKIIYIFVGKRKLICIFRCLELTALLSCSSNSWNPTYNHWLCYPPFSATSPASIGITHCSFLTSVSDFLVVLASPHLILSSSPALYLHSRKATTKLGSWWKHNQAWSKVSLNNWVGLSFFLTFCSYCSKCWNKLAI